MDAKRIVSFAAVFVAGALALAGFTTVTGGMDKPADQGVGFGVAAQEDASVSPGHKGSGDTRTSSEGSDGSGDDITAIAELDRLAMVNVQGRVQAVVDEDEFTLVDDTGSITVWTGGVLFTVDTGDVVTVRGFIDDDWPMELTAREIIHADGSVITIGSSSD